MQLTHHTDYSLRILLFLSLQKNSSLITINNIAEHFDIPKSNLSKAVHQLARLGYVKTVRGKNGGICLAQSTDRVNLGILIQAVENNTEIVNCQKIACPLIGQCELKGILNEAQRAFFSTLGKYSLADISQQSEKIKGLLNWV